jgi:hypothetical protein
VKHRRRPLRCSRLCPSEPGVAVSQGCITASCFGRRSASHPTLGFRQQQWGVTDGRDTDCLVVLVNMVTVWTPDDLVRNRTTVDVNDCDHASGGRNPGVSVPIVENHGGRFQLHPVDSCTAPIGSKQRVHLQESSQRISEAASEAQLTSADGSEHRSGQMMSRLYAALGNMRTSPRQGPTVDVQIREK